MNLLRETSSLFGWLYRIGGVFLRLRPLTTLTVIAASTLSRITGILAFVLPIKVILLVASDGVSRWFEPIVGPDGKDTLVIVLTAAAVVSFFASIALDALTDRLAASTSRTVLQGSNELAVVGDQAGHARSIYAQYADFVAGTLFVGAGLAVVGLINPPLAGALVGALLVEFAFTAAILSRADRVHPRFPARFILQDLGDYLKILSSVNFLLAFGILLYPFLWGEGGSVLGALVSVIVLRRILGVMVGVARGAVGMASRKPMIDALVFRDRQYRQAERQEVRSLRDVFHKTGRQARTAEALRSAGIEFEHLEVCWQDSRLQGVSLLAVHGETPDGSPVRYQQQIFAPKQDYRLRNEEVLFGQVARERLHAPRLVLRFSEGPFECQLCAMGTGELVDEDEWATTEWELVTELMSIAPPPSLVEAFSVSRPLLVDRLSDSFVERLEMGVDTEEEEATFHSLRQAMPEIREILGAMPLHIDNPELRRTNVMQDTDGSPLIMAWGQWTLEPVGATLSPGLTQKVLDELLDDLRSKRSDITDAFTLEHLQFAGTAMKLEIQIRYNLLKEGLTAAERLTASDVLSQHRGARVGEVVRIGRTA